ncbi:MAG: insulinase family protein [Clostridiales bacterium]|jgi:predicted Zn-dependent peptidase|nr:insulinase family protein [Clostridiales bacterium]
MINVYTLDNGLRVVMETIPFVRSISFGIWVRNGSRDEDGAVNGISHFIEHMMFKGTERRSGKDIADEMDAIGGQINAYTSKEYTCYYTRTLDTHFDTALDVLSDMFFHSKFDSADINKERNVILEEINMYEDTPEDLVHDLLQNKVYANDSLGLTILGSQDNVNRFQREDFTGYLKKHYGPDKTVLAVAGNFDEAEVLNKLKALFGPYQSAGKAGGRKPAPVYGPAFNAKDKDIEQMHLCVGLPGIAAGSDETYTMAALNTIFGGGMSSRLFQTIREERGLVYSVYSYNSGFADTGLFTVYAALNPAQTGEVFALILSESRRMFTEKVSAEQLAKTKEQLKSNFLLSLESSSNRMNSIGRTMLMLDKIVTAEELIEKIDAISLDGFYALCEKVFNLDKISISIVGKQAEAQNLRSL